MDYVQIVLFAIQAAIRLGQKILTVFEDETRDRDLILPMAETTGLPPFVVAKHFFENDGKAFVQPPATAGQPGGPVSVSAGLYFSLWNRLPENNPDVERELFTAYLRISALSADDPNAMFRSFGGSQPFYDHTNALFVVKQWRDGTDPKRHPIQRIGGTVVEIALDFVKADPTLFGGAGAGEHITRAFLLSLDDIDFAETPPDELLLDIFQASLHVLRDQSGALISDEHLALLLSRVTATLSDDVKRAQDSGDPDKLRALLRFRREILQDVIKTSAATVADQASYFLGTPSSSGQQLLDGVLKAVLGAVQQEPDLFSGRAIADIYAASLNAVGQNANLIFPGAHGGGREVFLATLFSRVATQLADGARATPPSLFSPDLLRDVIATAVDVTADNAAVLINANNPTKQLLADALQRILLGFSPTLHQDQSLPATLSTLFSRQQLNAIVAETFAAVANNPAALLQGVGNEAQRSALAQLIGAIATAVSQDPHRLLTGDGIVQLLHIVLAAFAKNPDRLLDLNTSDVRQQILTQVISSVLTAVNKNLDSGGRDLVRGDVLLQLIETAIAAVSGNVDGFRTAPDVVSMVLDRVLHAASNVLANELDAAGIVASVGPILRKALADRTLLNASDADLIHPVLRDAA